MSEVRQRKFMYSLDYDEPPPKKAISEGDILIKQLAEKQRNTSTSLEKQLVTTKEFTKATELVLLSKYNPGATSLKCFQETADHFKALETFKGSGLTTEDLELYFDSLKDDDYVFKKHKNWETNLLKQRLDIIQETVKLYEANNSKLGKAKLEGHEVMEHGLSIKPNGVEKESLRLALSTQKETNKLLPNHPINSIKEIEREHFFYLNESSTPSVSNIRRKARKLANRINRISKLDLKATSSDNHIKVFKDSASKWDVTTPEKEETKGKIIEKKTYTCKPQSYYTIRNREIVKLNKSECEARQLETAPTTKLSTEEIKKLPKFQNYESGNPSKVLYLRNLNNNVKEEELQNLFKGFDKDKSVSYKVMKGKMRGQAFVSFQDETIASQALEGVNGTFIRNKPVIIQFSHTNSTNL